MDTEIISKISAYVRDTFQGSLPEHCHYHNLTHTEEVVTAVSVIAMAEQLPHEEIEIVTIAAWFHDLGHVQGSQNHEEKSIKLAIEKLKELEYPQEKIEQVADCIRATRMPQSPKSKMEEILCDADLHHLSTPRFQEKSEMLMTELSQVTGIYIEKNEWYKKTYQFVKEHKYFTKYAKQNLESVKQENLRRLEEKIQKEKKSKEDKLKKKIYDLEEKLAKAKSKESIPTRGIETMFRTTSRNHLDLSSIADQKSNIMISVNSIILSIVVTVLLRKLEEYPHFMIPTLILTIACLSTIVLSILATRPNVSKGKFTKDDIIHKKANLLFFGNFHQMSLEEYEWGMNELMNDSQYLYGSLTKDIYYLGKVLGKKYRMLRIAYTVFMFGFVIAIISFIIAEAFFKSHYMY
ncbi:DUF5706 domain-containing protein [Reichenbachiella agarivorans]|uniref:DUF5706 domain-containing protein n=1 Tax=Reichenbachiella agarivorans TaxID=2979464 RepID=A0ABY6CSY7_9BACT|nr:Pycsar system effector family protein [Reichenbachiella agarivorans]UXP33454.1 DUF5706 domain-containing protein [Reichenbachiella agarivorans]